MGRRSTRANGVLAAFVSHGRAVRSDDDAVRSGAGAQWDLLVLPGLGIGNGRGSALLAAVPHRTVARRRDVVRIGAGRQLIERHLCGERRVANAQASA